jgi:hypothetical protein
VGRTDYLSCVIRARGVIGDICALYTSTECQNQFKAAGYA